MNNKHRAVWAALVLLLVFLAILAWYLLLRPHGFMVPPDNTATSTPVTAAEPITIKDSGRFYDIEASYPSATPLRESAGAAADAEAIVLMKAFIENTSVAFKENNNLYALTDAEFNELTFGRDARYAMGIDYSTYESPRTVSYVYAIYQDTMGAHPNTYYRTFTFDRETGHALELEELFVDGAPYLERLSARTRADLPKIMGDLANMPASEVDADYINSGTMPIGDSFGNFAIDGATLLMIFPPYQVGPYVYGTITDPIPLSVLADILAPKYRP